MSLLLGDREFLRHAGSPSTFPATMRHNCLIRLGLEGSVSSTLAYSLLLLDRIEAIMGGFLFSASHSPARSNTLPSGP